MIIADVKAANRIEAELAAAGVELHQRGGRLVGCCPLHSEEHPSFYVFRDEQKFKCFGCQESGDVIDLVQQLYHVNFKGALKHLGVEDGHFRLSPVERKRIDAIRAERDRLRQRHTWLGTKVDELSILVRCGHLLLDGIKTEQDLEARAFLYHLLPVWKYQLSILLEGWNWEKWEFYNYEIKGASNGQREKRTDSERDSAQNC